MCEEKSSKLKKEKDMLHGGVFGKTRKTGKKSISIHSFHFGNSDLKEIEVQIFGKRIPSGLLRNSQKKSVWHL